MMGQPQLNREIPSAGELAQAMQKGWESYVLRGRSAFSKHDYVYASGYSECERRMVYEMTRGDEQKPFDAEVYAKFRRGNDRERDMISDLMKIGRDCDPPFEVISQQERFELRDKQGRVAIVGKVDARIRYPWRAAYPLEIKSWSVFLTDQVNQFSDLFENRWTKRGAYQLLMYLLAAGEPLGFILLDRPGLPMLLPVELNDANLERAEEFLARSERALNHREAGTLPDFIKDREECDSCPFMGTVCQAPRFYEPVEVLQDAEIEALLEERDEAEEARRRFEKADKKVKAHFRPDKGKDVKTLVIGKEKSFLLKGFWGKQTSTSYPPWVDRRYKRTKVDTEGRFTLKIERV